MELTGAMRLPLIILVFSVWASRPSIQTCTVPAPKLKESRYQRLPLDNLVLTQETLSKKTAASDLDCGRKCGFTEGCVKFTFLPGQNGPQGECRMYGELVVDSEMDQGRYTGARSYGLEESTKKCDNGYSTNCSRCLMFVNTLMTFAQAKDHCQAMDNGHLAVAKTVDDLNCFAFVMETNGLMWLGVDDLTVEGRYTWHDGTDLPLDSPLWNSNEPNGHSIENCLNIAKSSPKLHDYPCSYNFYAMCQKDL